MNILPSVRQSLCSRCSTAERCVRNDLHHPIRQWHRVQHTIKRIASETRAGRRPDFNKRPCQYLEEVRSLVMALSKGTCLEEELQQEIYDDGCKNLFRNHQATGEVLPLSR